MPVLTLECPDCGNVFLGGIFPGTKPPEVWVCSRCRGERSTVASTPVATPHPWDADHTGCGCCG